MREVYAIVSGEYSDYRIHAIYERREDAERALAIPSKDRDGSDERIEAFPWYPADGPPLGMDVQ